MDSGTTTIEKASLTDAISIELIRALNEELQEIYTEPGTTHFRLDPDEVAEGRGVFLVIYRDGIAIGCGAFRLIDAGTAELKRMYVVPEARGTGLGGRLVDDLEAEARAMGASRLILETGIWQEAALALYRRKGFEPIPLYGEYLGSPKTSVCLGKELRVI